MRNYQGPVLVLLDGVETETIADLTAEGSGHDEEWGGTLEARAGLDLEGLEMRPVSLRLPNGEGSEALVDWSNTTGAARVIGNSQAPF